MRLLHLAFVVVTFSFLVPTATAQPAPPDAAVRLADEAKLRSLLPEQVGPYVLVETAHAPEPRHEELVGEAAADAVIEEDVEAVEEVEVEVVEAEVAEEPAPAMASAAPTADTSTLTALYEAPDGRAFTLALTQVRRPGDRSNFLVQDWEATETAIAGHSGFAEEDPSKVALAVGETVAAVAVEGRGEVSVGDLSEALAAVDLAGLDALDAEYVQAVREAAQPDAPPTDAITGIEGSVECASFNEEVKAQAGEMMGTSEFAPWVLFLDEEQAAEADLAEGLARSGTNEGLLSFPKAGNPWLECVRENDLLWAPLGAGGFLLRVKTMWETPERATFWAERAGFRDVIVQGRIEAGER
jgi:hypothetical protein